MTKTEPCLCRLNGVIDVIAGKWSLFILNVIGNNDSVRFNEIMRTLKGISPTTLSQTLEKLVGVGLVDRRPYPEIPPRVEYSMTRDGKELLKAIVPVLLWAATRDPAKNTVDPTCPVFVSFTR